MRPRGQRTREVAPGEHLVEARIEDEAGLAEASPAAEPRRSRPLRRGAVRAPSAPFLRAWPRSARSLQASSSSAGQPRAAGSVLAADALRQRADDGRSIRGQGHRGLVVCSEDLRRCVDVDQAIRRQAQAKAVRPVVRELAAEREDEVGAATSSLRTSVLRRSNTRTLGLVLGEVSRAPRSSSRPPHRARSTSSRELAAPPRRLPVRRRTGGVAPGADGARCASRGGVSAAASPPAARRCRVGASAASSGGRELDDHRARLTREAERVGLADRGLDPICGVDVEEALDEGSRDGALIQRLKLKALARARSAGRRERAERARSPAEPRPGP